MLTLLILFMLRSFTIPSSVVELDSGGDGVPDLNDDAPDEDAVSDAGDGRSGCAECVGWCGEHESFMSSIAAEHSERTSVVSGSRESEEGWGCSSGRCSLVRRLRELEM